VYIRKIKVFLKLKDYKNAMSHLAQFLSFIPSENFKTINKIPRWIDKVVLVVLAEYQINEIISWISDSSKYVIDFIVKKLIQRYKYWLDNKHELNLAK
jgi:hypothetical protein